MSLDFGSNGSFSPYFKYDARVGWCKFKATKEDEPQIMPPIVMAVDVHNVRQLHLCFPSGTAPQRLYYSDTIDFGDRPPPVGSHEFKPGFDVQVFVLNKFENENIGILPFMANSIGATRSFNRMHDLWEKGEEVKQEDGTTIRILGKDNSNRVPIFTISGTETVPLGKSFKTEVMMVHLERWVERNKIPGFEEALQLREESNVSFENPIFEEIGYTNVTDDLTDESVPSRVKPENDIFGEEEIFGAENNPTSKQPTSGKSKEGDIPF